MPESKIHADYKDQVMNMFESLGFTILLRDKTLNKWVKTLSDDERVFYEDCFKRQRDLGGAIHKPDALLRRGDIRIAVELQHSCITGPNALKRYRFYHSLGFHTMWITTHQNIIQNDEIYVQPSMVEKWKIMLQQWIGFVFIWREGELTAWRYHDPKHNHESYVEENYFQFARDWYDIEERRNNMVERMCFKLKEPFNLIFSEKYLVELPKNQIQSFVLQCCELTRKICNVV